ncbi:MAG: glycine--tRNA ligase subunit beta [Desulfovibrio sp.]|nr:glycine--tRNA ligase subunit beta [Desulfovibrio sp.]
MSTFVLEIGSEEIPARFLPGAATMFGDMWREVFKQTHIPFGALDVFTTPRRLVLEVRDLAEIQEEQDVVVVGPAKRVAYDAQGTPTKALEGFLRANTDGYQELFEQETEKGLYVCVRKRVGGKPSATIIQQAAPQIILGLPFAKKMRWGANQIAFARPIHWILALLDDAVVPFTVGPLTSDRITMGHRVHGKGAISVPHATMYRTIMDEDCGVVLDQAERKAYIQDEGDRIVKKVDGRVVWKEDLLEEVVGLVEHPVVVLGDFDPKYLELPREVLLTSMEKHQKSFGVEAENGTLLPHFVPVANVLAKDPLVVQKGWERVLHARLEDARFFWREDQKVGFAPWQEKLDGVIFVAGLGTMGDKTRRLAPLASFIATELFPEKKELLPLAERAGLLSKADLVSGMVGEFDTLQGIMGGIYAEVFGEDPMVANALKEQYLPAGPETALPKTELGAILSLADKFDTLIGCFGIKKIPTGAADPFALRRAALGIIRVLAEYGWSLSLAKVFAKAQSLYTGCTWKVSAEKALAMVLDFVGGRLSNYLQGQYPTIEIEACMRAGFDSIPDLLARLHALHAFTESVAYVPSVQILKRIANILQKKTIDTPFSAALLQEDAEKDLANALAVLREYTTSTDYPMLLALLPTFRAPVDAFFEKVMVISEDEQITANRMALLNILHSFYGRICQVSCLQI